MKFKRVMTWSPKERKFRFARLIWQKGVMLQGGYSAKLSFAAVPKLFSIRRNSASDVRVVVFGISFHYQRSYGGYFV